MLYLIIELFVCLLLPFPIDSLVTDADSILSNACRLVTGADSILSSNAWRGGGAGSMYCTELKLN